MRAITPLWRFAAPGLLVFLRSPAPAGAQCVSGTVVADHISTGPCAGYYRYTATITTNLGPVPGGSTPVFLIKNGRDVCSGQVVGDCPIEPCDVPIEVRTWGGLKSRFGD